MGGIVGGFLILGVLTYWWVSRYKRRLTLAMQGPRGDDWHYGDSDQFGSINSAKRKPQNHIDETVVDGGRLGKQI